MQRASHGPTRQESRRLSMLVLRRRTAPRYIREAGITSYLLASPRTCKSNHITTTLVEIRPGGEQRIHSHMPEQVYFILGGCGMMTVAGECQRVGPGDCIFIPSQAAHGLTNDGDTLITYLSAAAPSFSAGELESLWPLKSEAELDDR
jgi:mannose-6-phosphate isomerase-like protein (cupin superfamily)